MSLRKKKIIKLEAEVAEVHNMQEEIHDKTAKIDKLSNDLHKHLQDNNFGRRMYFSLVQNWR